MASFFVTVSIQRFDSEGRTVGRPYTKRTTANGLSDSAADEKALAMQAGKKAVEAFRDLKASL